MVWYHKDVTAMQKYGGYDLMVLDHWIDNWSYYRSELQISGVFDDKLGIIFTNSSGDSNKYPQNNYVLMKENDKIIPELSSMFILPLSVALYYC